MVDGVVLLVDASEGPLPQTRFVLRKALEANLPVILVINKVDRPDARIAEVVDACYELFIDLDATEDQIEFPIVYAAARAGRASLNRPEDGAAAGQREPRAALRRHQEHRPRPDVRPGRPAAGARHQPGRLAPTSAASRCAGSTTARSSAASRSPGCKHDGSIERVKITELFLTEALERKPADEAGPGDIVAIAGIADIMIGDTLADPNDPRPLPLITVDEPAISMTLGTNTSPLAGRERGHQGHRAPGQGPSRPRARSAT